MIYSIVEESVGKLKFQYVDLRENPDKQVCMILVWAKLVINLKAVMIALLKNFFFYTSEKQMFLKLGRH